MFIPIQAIPYLRLVKRLFSGPGSLQAIAYRQEILCPEEKTIFRPAVFLPGQIDKVTDYKATNSWSQTTKEVEIAEAISTKVTHAPTVAYHIKDAVIFDGSIYVGYFRHPIADKSLYVSAAQEPHHINTGALASSYLGTKYFAHWLADDCTRYLLAEKAGPPLCLRGRAFGHQQKYQAYFGQDWTPTDRARIDHLVIFQDFSHNSLKRKRYRKLRGRIKTNFPGKSRGTLIYLKRGQSGVARTIQNEDEIVEALTKRDFVIVDVASDSLDQIIGNLVNAKIVVSIEGSHLAHCTFASPENSGLLVLQPPDRFSANARGRSECIDVNFGFVVGAVRDNGYYFSVSEILLTIDLLLNKVEA